MRFNLLFIAAALFVFSALVIKEALETGLLKRGHVPPCESCNLDEFERVMNGVCNCCYKRATQKDIFQGIVLVYLIVVFIISLWPVMS